jgi:hypothetical protein
MVVYYTEYIAYQIYSNNNEFGHHFLNDTLIFSLIEFSLKLLVLFSNIMSLFLPSLHEYVNTIRIRIIITFCYDCYIILMSIVLMTIMTP